MTSGRSEREQSEPDAYVMSRRLHILVRALLVIALVATVLLLLFYRPAAYLAAIPIPFLIVLLVLINYYERRSKASELRQPGQRGISQEEVDADVEEAGIFTVVVIAILVALGTFIIAASMFDWEIVGIVAAALLLLVILIDIPYIPLLVSEARRYEREKVTGRKNSDEDSEAKPD